MNKIFLLSITLLSLLSTRDVYSNGMTNCIGYPLHCQVYHYSKLAYNTNKLKYFSISSSKKIEIKTLEAIEEMINESNINQRDNLNRTPLHKAVMGDNTDVVKLLIKKGANTEDKTNPCVIVCEEDTPLEMAVKLGNTKVVEVLLNNNADYSRFGKKENAIKKSQERELIRLSRSYTNLKHEFAIERIDELLKSGTDINVKERIFDTHSKKVVHREQTVLRNTPLMTAIYRHNNHIAKHLISRGADINIKTDKGRTALTMAARAENFEMTKLLVEIGADHKVVNNDGRNALQEAERAVARGYNRSRKEGLEKIINYLKNR